MKHSLILPQQTNKTQLEIGKPNVVLEPFIKFNAQLFFLILNGRGLRTGYQIEERRSLSIFLLQICCRLDQKPLGFLTTA